jgi:uncharacterized protein (UPF0371 family)
MKQIDTTISERKVIDVALNKEVKEKVPVLSIELEDGEIITGKQTDLLTATSAALLNSIKHLAGIKDKLKLISPTMIEPLQKLKKEVLGKKNARLNAQDLLTILSITAPTNPIIEEALNLLTTLKGCEAHSTVVLGYEDASILKSLRLNVTQEAILRGE